MWRCAHFMEPYFTDTTPHLSPHTHYIDNIVTMYNVWPNKTVDLNIKSLRPVRRVRFYKCYSIFIHRDYYGTMDAWSFWIICWPTFPINHPSPFPILHLISAIYPSGCRLFLRESGWKYSVESVVLCVVIFERCVSGCVLSCNTEALMVVVCVGCLSLCFVHRSVCYSLFCFWFRIAFLFSYMAQSFGFSFCFPFGFMCIVF